MPERKRRMWPAAFVLSAAVLVGALYMTGTLYAAVRVLAGSVISEFLTQSGPFVNILSPSVHLECFRQYGFPVGLFSAVLISGAAMEAALLYAVRSSEKGKDRMGRKFRHSTARQSYGNAHFEEPEEYADVAVVQSPENAWGTIVGQLTDDGTRLINMRMDNTRVNRHMTVFGLSGGGKTFSFVRPYCYQTAKRRESIIINDPKGELYRETADMFEKRGYVIRRLDLSDFSRSDGWDCLKTIRPETMESDAQIFAQTVVSNVEMNTSGVFVNGPIALLKALILKVCLDPSRKESERNIGEVYQLLQSPAGEAYLDTVFDPRALTEAELPCLGPYLSFKQGSPNLRGNIITNLSVQLNVLQQKAIRKVLSTDDIDLLLPGKRPCAYYCVFPDSHDTYRFLVSLFFSMLFTNLIDFADHRCGGKLPVPVNFMMDEFANIGKLPDWDRKMATIRSRNMTAVMILQNITQLQNNYDTAWITIISNCGSIVVININDPETAEYIGNRIGETTIRTRTVRHGPGDSVAMAFRGGSESENRRELLTPSELHELGVDDCLVIITGHNPIWARMYPHTLHPYSEGIRERDPADLPLITDGEARAAMRTEEKRRVDEYLMKHPLPTPEERKYEGKCESDGGPGGRAGSAGRAAERIIALIRGVRRKKREKIYPEEPEKASEETPEDIGAEEERPHDGQDAPAEESPACLHGEDTIGENRPEDNIPDMSRERRAFSAGEEYMRRIDTESRYGKDGPHFNSEEQAPRRRQGQRPPGKKE